MPGLAAPPRLVCPACRGSLDAHEDGFRCLACVREFPRRFGFVDLRLARVPDVDYEDDLQSAAALAEQPLVSFAELLTLHYQRRPEAAHDAHLAHLATETAQAGRILPSLGDAGAFLDLGCGVGRWLEAASNPFEVCVGVDASLVQLVLARAYLAEQGVEARLFAAEIESLPFPDESFSAAVATDVLEHVSDPASVCREAARVLAPGGALYAVAPNRYSLTLEPHVGVWGLGFLPRDRAERYVERRFGVDYRSIRPPSWQDFRRTLGAFPGKARVRALQPGLAERALLSPAMRVAAILYGVLLRVPVLGTAVTRLAPAFEAWARKPARTL